MILNEINISRCLLGNLFLTAGLLALGVLAGSFILAWIFERCSWGRLWRMVERKLQIGFSVVWIMGFCVYCVGMYIMPENNTLDFWRLFNVMPMAIIHAFEMFLLESDASAIHAHFHENFLFMTVFSVVHFLAALVSLAFVLKHFGYNLIASARLRLAHSFLGKNPEKLYIFWGMNEANYLLAESIKNDPEVKNENYKILFVKTSDEDDNQNNRTGLDRLFNFFSVKNKELDKLKNLECLSAHSFRMLSKCELKKEEKIAGVKILDEKLGLGSIVELMKKTTGEIYVFMLSEDESINLKASSNLCYDSDIKSIFTEKNKLHIYCHARRDCVNRVAEDSLSGKNIEVHIVDSSTYSINELKSNVDNHPIKFVDIDTDDNYGAVKSCFSSLVVGFGETGRDAARFLYEFSAFTSAESSKEEDVPNGNNANISISSSGFICNVIDSEMKHIKGRFLSTAPALANENSGFSFHNYDVNSKQFLNLLYKISSKLNYVVVALGNDELNITTAIKIFEFVRSHRKNLEKFRIYVKCSDASLEGFMKNVENHYNQVRPEHKNDESIPKYIQIFGTYKKIYTYKQIIENNFEKEGKDYNDMYCKVSGNNGIKDVWNTRHEELLKSHKLDDYSTLRRKEFQDVQNAYHALTKIYIMQQVCLANPSKTKLTAQSLSGIKNSIPDFTRPSAGKSLLSGIITATNLPFTEVEQLMFRNIARMEHLRWNASHRTLGYESYSSVEDEEIKAVLKNVHKCNEQFRLHNCLIDWTELDKESDESKWTDNNGEHFPDYKLYDFITITTTLKLLKKKS